ncbi:MAG: hypothetical protein ACRD0G_16325 [Acidimicrobiales bacterium]
MRSPGAWRYDTGRKRQLYEEAGAAELWLVDHLGRGVAVAGRSQPDVRRRRLPRSRGRSHHIAARRVRAVDRRVVR